MPRLGQMTGHGPAHDAEPDESNFHNRFFSLP
jgi:hypothetical protein